MTDLRRLGMAFAVACSLTCATSPVYASRKATDMMSEALKQRAAGNLGEAISSLEYAAEQAGNVVQQNLARFMLGDCQLESGRYADAARTFSALSESVKSGEEKAEALFRLLQANSGLGNQGRVNSIFAQLKRDHGRSPYCELAKSFMKTQGFKEEAASPEPEKKETLQPVVAAEAEPEKPTPVAKKAEPATKPAKPAPVAAIEADDDILPDERPQPDHEITEMEEAPPPEEKPVARPEPAKTTKAEVPARVSSQKERPAAASAPAIAGKGMKKADPQTATLLRSILQVETAAGSAKDELVSRILGLQDSLKDGPEKAGMDKVLMDLAEATTGFGELLEACKTYDKVLTHHPASPLVEKAYFQAIRLRAVLGVHEAVVGWSKAFLAAFPASEYRSQVRALVEYSQAGGQLDLSAGGSPVPATATVKGGSGARSAAGADTSSANAALAADSQYAAASRKMKDGKYTLALVDFNRLAKKYPDAPQIWWDAALVNVQLEDFKKAAVAINRMLELDPGNQDANSLSGYIHYRLENFEEAASAYDQAGEPEGRGVNFFDAKTASERMKKTAEKKK
ncbi:MAG TPA: tetratricopeptide repeat protein [Candidatus Rifleibacterium sp.]|nr:tetratricopeptide repeat protein [Candidatus Rifleibacterium sp.]